MKGDGSIRDELAELVPGFSWPRNALDFQVPEGYFEALHARVLAEIASPALLPEKPAHNPYNVPPGYFKELPQKVLAKVKKPGRVLRLTRSRSSRTRWLAAAVIIAIVVLAALLRLSQHQAVPSIDRQLASVSDAAITGYLSAEAASLNDEDLYSNVGDSLGNSLVNGLSNQDIEEYLNEDSPESY